MDGQHATTDRKSTNIFVADQTPTPTCLIKNCEEVGLFEDLQHVNPFEETFRRAVETSRAGQTTASTINTTEDSLHTPQVLLDGNADEALEKKNCCVENANSVEITLDVPIVEDLLIEHNIPSRQNANIGKPTSLCSFGDMKIQKQRSFHMDDYTKSPSFPNSIQIIQPQLITLSFLNGDIQQNNKKAIASIPVQTVKPFILPKITNNSKEPPKVEVAKPSNILEPNRGSASLTPTSLPVKERLKAILSHSSRSHSVEIPKRNYNHSKKLAGTKFPMSDDCMERRRAAATRYRQKMRNEHKELRKRNLELQKENDKLRCRVQELENDLQSRQNNASTYGILPPAQIQIPSSTIHLIMNIPKLLVPSMGQPSLQNPITYSLQKK